MHKRFRLEGLGTALAALALCVACAGARADEGDPPGRAARLSDMEGSVALEPAGADEWTQATLNRPLTTGDRIWSDHDSRAELDVGAVVLRLGAQTGVGFLNLDDDTAQVQLSEGTLIVRVRDLQPGQTYEVDTPNLALLLQQDGEYRLEVNEAGDDTLVKISQGAAQASAGGQTVAISAQQAVDFSGAEHVDYASVALGAPDDLDSWSGARERQLEDSASREYVADEVAGAQDLDNNGTWVNTPEYGYVWTPAVVFAGWVPYRFGHWAWIAPWGWTWIDDARWGYAPFHYGRWLQYHNDWCWVPGPRRVRPVYAPALVGWFRDGAIGTAVAPRGGVAWFPLGPREVYVPPYRVSQGYVRIVNTANTTRLNNRYITDVYERNVTPLHYANNSTAAVTAVPESVFTSGQRIGARAVRVPAELLEGASVSAAAPAIAPLRQSVLGPGLGRVVVRPPSGVLSRPIVARTSPPRAPAPLERQISAVQANGGRALTRADLAQLQPPKPAIPVRVVATGTVISAATLRRVSATHPTATSTPAHVPAAPEPTAPGLIERERTLQSSRVTSMPHPPTYAPPSAMRDEVEPPAVAVRVAPTAPEWREDRPSGSEARAAMPRSRSLPPDDPAHAYSRPGTIPVYHPPSAVPAAVSPARPAVFAPPRAREPSPAQPRPPNQPPPTFTPHPGASPRASEPEPRGAGPHADRTSRDRIQR